MGVIAGWLVPHPPLIFPEVGCGKEKEIAATVASYKEMGAEIAAAAPDTVVILSPHAQIYADYFHISPGEGAAGDMRAYGVSGVDIRAAYDAEFSAALSLACEAEDFPAGTLGERNKALDHATAIPVRFINEACADGTAAPKFIRAGVSGLSLSEHYRFGELIAETSEKLGRKTVVIASGDLSHRLKDEGPYGFAPEGPEFDRVIGETAEDADFSRLFELDGTFCEKAGECGHRPLVVMAGALDRKAVDSKLYSYEGPFGVGYGVASFVVKGEDAARAFLDRYLETERKHAAAHIRDESPQVALARRTVENYVKTGRLYENPEPLPEELTAKKAGVFVSIKKQGQLRGCIGTISPVAECIGEEIRANAVSAAIRDPRFSAIEEDELPYLEYSVDVLAPAEPVENADTLDPSRYGVIVSLGGRRGLLLPDLEGIDDAETQIGIAMRKAGIAEKDRPRVKLERFEVIRYR
ncbi:MAG: AmmeMemoRadiSam system protein A [Clostridiales bacterium]|nr:AmmeMemoRadiSam system protein A [Clostridiales bacterium]